MCFVETSYFKEKENAVPIQHFILVHNSTLKKKCNYEFFWFVFMLTTTAWAFCVTFSWKIIKNFLSQWKCLSTLQRIKYFTKYNSSNFLHDSSQQCAWQWKWCQYDNELHKQYQAWVFTFQVCGLHTYGGWSNSLHKLKPFIHCSQNKTKITYFYGKCSNYVVKTWLGAGNWQNNSSQISFN